MSQDREPGPESRPLSNPEPQDPPTTETRGERTLPHGFPRKIGQ
jgi:hypothetical protein